MIFDSTCKRTVVFADISNSTHLYEILSDTNAQKIIAHCLDIMSTITRAHEGVVIKTIGDELLCTFKDANSATLAAMEMQEKVSSVKYSGTQSMSLHIGFHHGGIIKDKNDIFGDTVNIAARIVSKAKAKQILTTLDTLKTMDQSISSRSRMITQARIKGKTKEMKLYELVWGESDDMTIAAYNDSDHNAWVLARDKIVLMLTFKGEKYYLNGKNPQLTLGRSWENSIVIQDHKVSRLHARLEFRYDKFILIDQSINGTHIYPEKNEKILIRQDETPLKGKGYITLANEQEPDSIFAVHYQYVT